MDTILEFFANHGSVGLGLLSFIESFIFPIPPDLLLIGLAVAKPEYALWYATITTAASVLGGIIGHYIGVMAGRPLLERWISKQLIKKSEQLFGRYGGWAVAIAGFSPVPYKVFTIAAGVFKINRVTFIIASALSRGARFYLEAALILLIGAQAKSFIQDYFELITLAVLLAVFLLYVLLKQLKKLKAKESRS